MTETNRRLHGADFIRACACLVVLFHHLAQRIDPASAMGSNPVVQVFTSGGGFGVGMFFVLSGFLLSRPFWTALDHGRPLPSLGIYALQRAARILPGFWVALTASLVLSIAVFEAVPDGWLFLRYVAGFFLVSDWHWTSFYPVEVNTPLWSIGFEVTSYVLLPLGFLALFALGHGNIKPWQARLAWLAVVAAALGAHQLFVELVVVDPSRTGWQFGLQGGAKTWMPWFNPFAFFAMFAIGALAGGVQVVLARYRSLMFDALALVALGATGAFIWSNAIGGPSDFYGLLHIPYGFPVFQLLIGATLAVIPSTIVVGRLLDNRVVRSVATLSFGIYIWHFLVLELVRHWFMPELAHGQMADMPSMLAGSALVVAITIAIAAASYRWIEAPVIAWARGLEGRRDTTPAFA